METSTCKLNVFFANTKADYLFDQATKDMLAATINTVIMNSKINVSKALFIYQASLDEGCKPYMVNAMQEIFGHVTVECIQSGREGEMIDNAQCLLFGGGNMTKLTNAMSPFAARIWKKVLSGVPFIGINTGAAVLSSSNLAIPSGTCSNFSYFPLQFMPGYDPATGLQSVKTMLNNRPLLKYVLCMPGSDEGGIVLEESRSGLAGGAKDSLGGGSVTRPLYIYERDGSGGVRSVSWSYAQKENLPINYM